LSAGIAETSIMSLFALPSSLAGLSRLGIALAARHGPAPASGMSP